MVFKHFWDFHPEPWGNDPIWRAYCSNGLVQPPTRHCVILNFHWQWALVIHGFFLRFFWKVTGFQNHVTFDFSTTSYVSYKGFHHSVDGRTLVEVGSFSHYVPGFIHPKWLFGISSIILVGCRKAHLATPSRSCLIGKRQSRWLPWDRFYQRSGIQNTRRFPSSRVVVNGWGGAWMEWENFREEMAVCLNVICLETFRVWHVLLLMPCWDALNS